MFEAFELGREVDKAAFKEREPELRLGLLETQRRLARADFSVLVIVSGVEGAGKGEVVDRLLEWLDARGVETNVFWDESDEERQRPRFWRFWRAMPPAGKIGIMFGSWYTRPIIDRVYDEADDATFERELQHVAEVERMLSVDATLVVKLWFHLSKKAQRRRVKKDAKAGKGSLALSPYTKAFAKRFDTFAEISARAIRLTDTGECPWHVVESDDGRYRDLEAGRIVLEAIAERLERAGPEAPRPDAAHAHFSVIPSDGVSVLDQVDLAATVDDGAYRKRLRKRQAELYELAWRARKERLTAVAVFEGWDASGKGGAIRRVIQGVDARLYRVISIAAPTDEERAHHYLWRFWRHIPRTGFTFYDRSWYGRVLVERVEGFARADEWRRAYQELNDFEEQLVEHGIVLLKFWLHIDANEQLRRFHERARTPWKKHKITDEDWRNRDNWGAYEEAVQEMVARTSTGAAPWTLVAGNCKRFARLQVVETFCQRLRGALD